MLSVRGLNAYYAQQIGTSSRASTSTLAKARW